MKHQPAKALDAQLDDYWTATPAEDKAAEAAAPETAPAAEAPPPADQAAA